METGVWVWCGFLLSFLSLPAIGFADNFSAASVDAQIVSPDDSKYIVVPLGLTEISSYKQCKAALASLSWYCDAKQESKDAMKILGHPYFDDQKILIGWFDLNQDGILDLISASLPYECGNSCPYVIIFSNESTVNGEKENRIYPVASASEWSPSVIVDITTGKVGIHFYQTDTPFWIDAITTYYEYEKGKP